MDPVSSNETAPVADVQAGGTLEQVASEESARIAAVEQAAPVEDQVEEKKPSPNPNLPLPGEENLGDVPGDQHKDGSLKLSPTEHPYCGKKARILPGHFARCKVRAMWKQNGAYFTVAGLEGSKAVCVDGKEERRVEVAELKFDDTGTILACYIDTQEVELQVGDISHRMKWSEVELPVQ